MDKLPPFALEEIVLYLDPQTAFYQFQVVCRRVFEEMKSDVMQSRYLMAVFRLPTLYRIPRDQFFHILSRAYSVQREPTQLISLTGFATTGGVDRGLMRYWVGNLFNIRSFKAYCSHENKNNIVCAGVLAILVPDKETQEVVEGKREIARMIRNNSVVQRLGIGQLPHEANDELTAAEEDFFLTMFARAPAAFFQQDQEMEDEARVALFSSIGRLHGLLTSSKLKYSDVQPVPGDPFLLEMRIDKESVRLANSFFWAREVVVSREGNYTCPVETFVVFVANEFVTLEGEEFTRFNNLLTSGDVEQLAASLSLPILPSTSTPDYCYYEFSPTSSSRLHPLIWGKFLTRSCSEISVPLHRPYTGKYLYIKLINPDSRMHEMNDQHDFTNIDIKFVGVRGFVESL